MNALLHLLPTSFGCIIIVCDIQQEKPHSPREQSENKSPISLGASPFRGKVNFER